MYASFLKPPFYSSIIAYHFHNTYAPWGRATPFKLTRGLNLLFLFENEKNIDNNNNNKS